MDEKTEKKLCDYRQRTLPRAFYVRGAAAVARELLGCLLVHVAGGELCSGVIVETEAYAGFSDAACHSYKRTGPAPGHRTNVMFEEGGYAYVYRIYGMYDCFNVVTSPAGDAQAVLIRALVPTDGVAAMRLRRCREDMRALCSGPGKLCVAMAISRAQYGADLCDQKSALFVVQHKKVSAAVVCATPRINVDYAEDDARLAYRFVLADASSLPFVSTKRFLDVPKRRA